MSHMASGIGPLSRHNFTAITPLVLPSGSSSDYAPVDATTGAGFSTVDVIRQATNAGGSTLTGLVAQDTGHFVVFENLGYGALTFKHESSLSIAANRFTLPSLADLVLPSGASLSFVYDTPTTRWRTFSVSQLAGSAGSGTVGAGTTNKLAKFTGMTAVGDSSISDDTVAVTIGAALKAGQLVLDAFITPTEISGTVEDWNPTGLETSSWLKVQVATGGAELGGITAPTTASTTVGRFLLVANHGDGSGTRGAAPLILKHRSNGSISQNRIIMPNSTDVLIPYGGTALLFYEDTVPSQWGFIAMATSNYSMRATVGDLEFEELTPTTLGATTVDNWNPTNWSKHSHVRIQGAGAKITGLYYYGTSVGNDPLLNSVHQAGYFKILENIGGGDIVISASDSASDATNRILSPTGSFILAPGSSCFVIYDFSAGSWRVLGVTVPSKLTQYGNLLPTTGAGDNPDFNPTGFAYTGHTIINPTGGAGTISGIMAQEDGAIRSFTSWGTIKFLHASGLSAGANQILLPNAYQAGGLTLSTYDCATFRYHGPGSRWYCINIAK